MNQKDEASDFTVEFFCDEAFDSYAKPTEYKCKALIGTESYATKAFVIKVVNP